MMLRHAREAAGLTQADLAQRAGLTQITISNIEMGKTMPGQSSQDKIARALNNANIDWYRTKLQGMLPLNYLDESPEERVARAVYLYFKTVDRNIKRYGYKVYFDKCHFICELIRIMPGLLNYCQDPEETKAKTEEFIQKAKNHVSKKTKQNKCHLAEMHCL
jgi:transcriptional regulator with XRE-family HTH domain